MAGSTGLTAGVAGRYATALFELADEAGALDAISADVAAVKGALAESPDLRSAFSDPSVTREQLAGVASALSARLGVGQTMQNFLGLMAKNRRLSALGPTLDAVEALAAEKRGETTAEVTSAAPLTDAQQQTLSSALSQAAGRTVHMKLAVDPELIGGVVVKLGSKMIDASLRSKLARLQTSMKEVG